MFKKIINTLEDYKTIATEKMNKHSENLRKINSDFAGNRLEKEITEENSRYSDEITEIRESCNLIVNRACDNLKNYVIAKIGEIDPETLEEVAGLEKSGIPLGEMEKKAFLDKYSYKQDYWAERAMIALCKKLGANTLCDFSLEENLNIIEQARSDAAFFINTYGNDVDDTVTNVALDRIGQNLEAHFIQYKKKFDSNPICTVQRYKEQVNMELSEQYRKISAGEDSYSLKKNLGKKILNNLWDEYIAGNSRLEYVVSLIAEK